MVTSDKQNVFISYARLDVTFARAVYDRLCQLGFECGLDTQDIVPGEDWQQRVQVLLLAADTVLFVISDHSVKSKVCRWELNQADKLGKRIVPIVLKQVPQRLIPANVSAINFVRADLIANSESSSQKFESQFWNDLLLALRVDDVHWTRELARWIQRAHIWDSAPKSDQEHYLPSGPEAIQLQFWLSRKPDGESELPQLLLSFIQAVLDQEQRSLLNAHQNRVRMSLETQEAVAILARQHIEIQEYEQAIRLALAALPAEAETRVGLISSPHLVSMLSAACQLSPFLTNAVQDSNMGLLSFYDGRTALHSAVHLTSTKHRTNTHAVVEINSNGNVVVRGVAAGKEYELLLEDTNAQVAMLHPTGETLIVQRRGDAALNAWNLRSRNPFPTPPVSMTGLQIQAGAISSVYCAVACENDFKVSPPGVVMITGGAEPKIHVWRITDPSWYLALRDQRQLPELLEFSPNGTTLLSLANGKLCLWDVETTTCQAYPIEFGGNYAFSVRFNNTGTRAAVAHDLGVTNVDLLSPKLYFLTKIPEGVEDVLFSHQGDCLLATTRRGRRLLITTKPSACFSRSTRPAEELLSPAVDGSGHVYRLLKDSNGSCRITKDLSDTRFVVPLTLFDPTFFWVNDEGSVCVVVGYDEQELDSKPPRQPIGWILDSKSAMKRSFRPISTLYTRLVSVSSQGNYLAFLDEKLRCCVVRIDIVSPEKFVSLPGDDKPTCFELSASGDVLALGFWSGLTKLFEIGETVRDLGGLSTTGMPAFNVRVGKSLVTAWQNSQFKDIDIFDFRSGTIQASVKGHEETIDFIARHGHGTSLSLNGLRVVEITRDDEYLLTIGTDNTVRLWRTTDGKEIVCLREPDGVLAGACLSPSQTHIFTWTKSGFGRIWCIESGWLMFNLFANQDEVLMAKWLICDLISVVSITGTVTNWDTTWITAFPKESLLSCALNHKICGDVQLTQHELAALAASFGAVNQSLPNRHTSAERDAIDKGLIARWQSRFFT